MTTIEVITKATIEPVKWTQLQVGDMILVTNRAAAVLKAENGIVWYHLPKCGPQCPEEGVRWRYFLRILSHSFEKEEVD